MQIERSQAPTKPRSASEVQEEIILCSNKLMNLYLSVFQGLHSNILTSVIGYTQVHCQLLYVEKVDVGENRLPFAMQVSIFAVESGFYFDFD